MSSTNLNKKSLPTSSQGMVGQDIISKMELGVTPLEIYAELLEAAIPADEIEQGFKEAGYEDISEIVMQYEQIMRQEAQRRQQAQESMMQQPEQAEMQKGGPLGKKLSKEDRKYIKDNPLKMADVSQVYSIADFIQSEDGDKYDSTFDKYTTIVNEYNDGTPNDTSFMYMHEVPNNFEQFFYNTKPSDYQAEIQTIVDGEKQFRVPSAEEIEMYKKMISEKSGLPKGQYGGGSIFFPQNLSQANYRKGDGYRPAQGWYLPEDLGNRGNVLGALATAGEAYTDLFSGKDIDGDGFKDGAFREFGKKRRVHKDNKHSYYSYKVETDINDPNVDPKTGKTKYIFDTKDLYEGRLDNEEDYAQRIFDNSKINYDPETQSYKAILTAHSTDPDVYGKEDREFLNDPTNKTISELYADIKANPEQAKGLYEWNVDIKNSGAPAGTQFGVNTSGAQGSYLRNEQGQQPAVNLTDIDRGMMFRQTGGESTMGMMVEPSLDPMMMENEDLQDSLDKVGPEFLQAFMQVIDQSQRQREYAEHYGLYKESPYARRKVKYAQGGIETDEYDRNGDGVIDDQDTIELDEVTIQAQGSGISQMPTLPPAPIQLSGTTPSLQPAPPPPLAVGSAPPAGAPPAGGGNPGGPPAPPSFDPPKITRGNKLKGTLNYLMDSPGVDAFAKVGNAAVATAGVINEMALNRRAEDAEKNLRFNLTQADNIYGTYEEREGDRGMWDVNTGLAQPDNLDVGYAQFGMEMPPMEMPKQEAEVVDVDFETLTNLISAGADIEIL